MPAPRRLFRRPYGKSAIASHLFIRLRSYSIVSVLGPALAVSVMSSEASAHVKWFCANVDVTTPPASLSDVLSPTFFLCLVGFLVLVFMGLLADGWVARLWPQTLTSDIRLDRFEELIIRVSIGGYGLLLWSRSAVVPWGPVDGTVLTPELLNHDWPTSVLQLVVTILVLTQESCMVAGLALFMLFAIGIARYGLFHMTDYVFFLGYAGYLVLTSWLATPFRRWRLPLLITSLGFSLMWVAIEKFLYPQWSAQILVLHPQLTFGFPVEDVVLIAGFVEFSLAFYIIVGRGLVRLGAIVLIAVFISAMPEFGRLDLVGHLPMIVILLLVLLRGATPLHNALRLRTPNPVFNAAAISGLFVITLAGMMATYYSMQLTVRL